MDSKSVDAPVEELEQATPDPKKVRGVYNSVLSLLECPICVEYMAPPIRQCCLGHHICNDCFKKVHSCPVCRNPKGTSRNFALEHLYDEMEFPCKYQEEGCRYSSIGSKMKVHVKYCEYSPSICPFAASIPRCEWKGKRKEVLDHASAKHFPQIRWSNSITYLHYNFANLTRLITAGTERQGRCHFSPPDVLFAYGKLFQTWYSLDYSGYLKWYVFYLGPEEEKSNYNFRVKIGGKHLEAIIEQKACSELETGLWEHDVQEENCVATVFYFVEPLCNAEGHLEFEIEIIEK